MERDVIQRLRGFFKAKEISVQKLSALLNMSGSTLSGKLNGSRGLDLDTLSLILMQYPELSTDWLLRGQSEPTNPAAVDTELQETCIEQAKEIMRLRKRIAELEKM